MRNNVYYGITEYFMVIFTGWQFLLYIIGNVTIFQPSFAKAKEGADAKTDAETKAEDKTTEDKPKESDEQTKTEEKDGKYRSRSFGN